MADEYADLDAPYKTDKHIVLDLYRREDGGLRICSRHAVGLILSSADPVKALSAVWPALEAIKNPFTK